MSGALILDQEHFTVAAKALRNKYPFTINHSDFYQFKTASAFAATIWLIGHDVVNWVISLIVDKQHNGYFRLSTKSLLLCHEINSTCGAKRSGGSIVRPSKGKKTSIMNGSFFRFSSFETTILKSSVSVISPLSNALS